MSGFYIWIWGGSLSFSNFPILVLLEFAHRLYCLWFRCLCLCLLVLLSLSVSLNFSRKWDSFWENDILYGFFFTWKSISANAALNFRQKRNYLLQEKNTLENEKKTIIQAAEQTVWKISEKWNLWSYIWNLFGFTRWKEKVETRTNIDWQRKSSLASVCVRHIAVLFSFAFLSHIDPGSERKQQALQFNGYWFTQHIHLIESISSGVCMGCSGAWFLPCAHTQHIWDFPLRRMEQRTCNLIYILCKWAILSDVPFHLNIQRELGHTRYVYNMYVLYM